MLMKTGKRISPKSSMKIEHNNNKKPKKRIPTKATFSSRIKRVQSKKIHSQKKALRKKPKNDE